MLSAEQLTSIIGGRPPAGVTSLAQGAAFHTGRLRPGDMFFALPGESSHGIRFAAEALEKGAAFIVSDAPHPQGVLVSDPKQALLELGAWARARLTVPVIGVTGSAGKTSTKTFVAAALEANSSPGNYNTPLALAATLASAQLGTEGRRPLVLELGIDHRGEMAQLVRLAKPSHGLLTLIAPSHVSGLGDLATIAREKALLLEAAPKAYASAQAAAHLPAALRRRVTTYGLEPEAGEADYRGRLLEDNGFQQRLEVMGHRFTLPYPGKAMALNALAALVLAQALGVPLASAAARLSAARLEPGRLQLKRVGGWLIVDDSYNSNPASAAQALEVLRRLPEPRIAILGDMLELGAEAERYHRELGAQTLDLDEVIAIGKAAAGIVQGNPQARYAPSLREALPLLADLPRQGTVLVKASRSMRFEQLVELLARQGTPA